MSDGSFTVDLGELSDAIGKISTERDTIHGGIAAMRATFAQIEQVWQSPAGTSFTTLTANFNRISDTLTGLLDDALGRMHTAYNNYSSTEDANTGNWNGGSGGPDPDTDHAATPPGQAPRTALNAPTATTQATAQSPTERLVATQPATTPAVRLDART